MNGNERLYHFDLFRYQLLPQSQNVQLQLFNVHSVEQLKEKKNLFFAEVLSRIGKLRHRGIEIIHRIDMQEDNWFVLHIGAQKTIERHKADFEKEKIEDWPHVIAVINNDPQVQSIAISTNPKAFSSSLVVAQMLQHNLQLGLRHYQLQVEVEALFEERAFWSVVEQYPGKVVAVTFELISPNMANISKSLELDLAKINKDTNSHRTDLKLNSGEGSSLEIRAGDKLINSLVEYAAAGGGDIAMRVRGIKKTIRTSKSIREVAVDEVVFENVSPQALAFFQDLFR